MAHCTTIIFCELVNSFLYSIRVFEDFYYSAALHTANVLLLNQFADEREWCENVMAFYRFIVLFLAQKIYIYILNTELNFAIASCSIELLFYFAFLYGCSIDLVEYGTICIMYCIYPQRLFLNVSYLPPFRSEPTAKEIISRRDAYNFDTIDICIYFIRCTCTGNIYYRTQCIWIHRSNFIASFLCASVSGSACVCVPIFCIEMWCGSSSYWVWIGISRVNEWEKYTHVWEREAAPKHQ